MQSQAQIPTKPSSSDLVTKDSIDRISQNLLGAASVDNHESTLEGDLNGFEKKRKILMDTIVSTNIDDENEVISVPKKKIKSDQTSPIQDPKYNFSAEDLLSKVKTDYEVSSEKTVSSRSSIAPELDLCPPSASSFSRKPYQYQDHAKKIANYMAKGNAFFNDERKKGGIKILFPEKLHKFLCSKACTRENSVLGWAPHGRSFVVRNPEKFINEITPLIFNHSTMASFQRQLNLYGFKRITKTGSRDEGAYYHEMFLQGRPDLCLLMRRKKIKGNQGKLLQIPSEEPDFYAMEPCNGNTGDQINLSGISRAINNESLIGPVPAQQDLLAGLLPLSSNMGTASNLLQVLSRGKCQNNNADLYSGLGGADLNVALRLYESEMIRTSHSRSLLEILSHQQPQINNAMALTNPLLSNSVLQGQLQRPPNTFMASSPLERAQVLSQLRMNLCSRHGLGHAISPTPSIHRTNYDGRNGVPNFFLG